jgi:hypothetical protein
MHIPYHTLDTAICTRLHPSTSVCNLFYIATSTSAHGNFPPKLCNPTLNVIPT